MPWSTGYWWTQWRAWLAWRGKAKEKACHE
jgi:hypothetical protein